MSAMEPSHSLSYFRLDLCWAEGPSKHPDVAAHVASCERCRAHLLRLGAAALAATPPWSAPSRRETSLNNARSSTMTRVAWGGGALTLAASSLLVWRLVKGPEEPSNYVGIKGTPAVQVVLRRADRTELWNGKEALEEGDAIALRVACEGFRHVTVASRQERRPWTRLTTTPCEEGAFVLPFSIRVDAEPGREQLAVILSLEALGAAQVESSCETAPRTSSTWVVRLDFPKSDPHQ